MQVTRSNNDIRIQVRENVMFIAQNELDPLRRALEDYANAPKDPPPGIYFKYVPTGVIYRVSSIEGGGMKSEMWSKGLGKWQPAAHNPCEDPAAFHNGSTILVKF